jgi:hypothetical protein
MVFDNLKDTPRMSISSSNIWNLIRNTGDDIVGEFAFTELTRYLQKMGIVINGLSCRQIVLSMECSETISEDGFKIESSTPDNIHIIGFGPRGSLYGVYAFLELEGCRWFSPGAENEVVPLRKDLVVPREPIVEVPAFRMRGLIDATCIGDDFTLAQVDWAAKMRLNTYQPHSFPIRNWVENAPPKWLPEFRKRGIIVQIGGHELPSLLPRTEKDVAEHPEYFRLKEGQRVADHNLCTSSPEAIRIIQRNFQELVRRCPDIQYWHLWPDDLHEGGWCECPGCRDLTPADQSMRATNALAEVLEEIQSPAKVSFIVYHDTITSTFRFRPHDKVVALLSLTERCETHGIGRCPRGKRYQNQIESVRQAGFKEYMTFERYIDSFKYRWMQPPTPQAIFDDARYFHSWPTPPLAHQCFVIMAREWHVPYPNYFLFARAAWNPDLEPMEIMKDFCGKWFGIAGPAMLEYYSILIDLFEKALVGCEYDESKGGSIILEPLDTVNPFAKKHAAKVEEAQGRLPECKALLMQVLEKAREDAELTGKIRREMDLLRITEIELAALRSAILGTHHRARYLANGNDQDRMVALDALRRVLKYEKEYTEYIRQIGLSNEANWFFNYLCKEIEGRANEMEKQ